MCSIGIDEGCYDIVICIANSPFAVVKGVTCWCLYIVC